MWDEVARIVRDEGRRDLDAARASTKILHRRRRSVRGVSRATTPDGTRVEHRGRLRLLDDAGALAGPRAGRATCPRTCAAIAEGLMYRDFITVGVLLDS